jgi:hypothetical protein
VKHPLRRPVRRPVLRPPVSGRAVPSEPSPSHSTRIIVSHPHRADPSQELRRSRRPCPAGVGAGLVPGVLSAPAILPSIRRPLTPPWKGFAPPIADGTADRRRPPRGPQPRPCPSYTNTAKAPIQSAASKATRLPQWLSSSHVPGGSESVVLACDVSRETRQDLRGLELHVHEHPLKPPSKGPDCPSPWRVRWRTSQGARLSETSRRTVCSRWSSTTQHANHLGGPQSCLPTDSMGALDGCNRARCSWGPSGRGNLQPGGRTVRFRARSS